MHFHHAGIAFVAGYLIGFSLTIALALGIAWGQKGFPWES